YKPAKNYHGDDSFSYKVSKVSDGSSYSTATVSITVMPQNDPPEIDPIDPQSINEDEKAGPISFRISDPETPSSDIQLDRASSDETLVPKENIVFGGNGEFRTVTVTPVGNRSGNADITVKAKDPQGAESTRTFTLHVTAVNDGPKIYDIADKTINKNG